MTDIEHAETIRQAASDLVRAVDAARDAGLDIKSILDLNNTCQGHIRYWDSMFQIIRKI